MSVLINSGRNIITKENDERDLLVTNVIYTLSHLDPETVVTWHIDSVPNLNIFYSLTDTNTTITMIQDGLYSLVFTPHLIVGPPNGFIKYYIGIRRNGSSIIKNYVDARHVVLNPKNVNISNNAIVYDSISTTLYLRKGDRIYCTIANLDQSGNTIMMVDNTSFLIIKV